MCVWFQSDTRIYDARYGNSKRPDVMSCVYFSFLLLIFFWLVVGTDGSMRCTYESGFQHRDIPTIARVIERVTERGLWRREDEGVAWTWWRVYWVLVFIGL
jgi:hypothetical protein